MSNILVYLLDGKIYINLTNRCTNDCIFCLRKDKDDVVGQTLWLDDENSTAQDVIKQFEVKKNELLSTNLPFTETIFCGYGEPMLKFDELKQVAKYIKEKYPKTKIRVNTNGHANYIYKKKYSSRMQRTYRRVFSKFEWSYKRGIRRTFSTKICSGL